VRIDQETRKRPVQLVALGGPVDGRTLVLRNRWDHAVVETIETDDGLPPLRSRWTEIRTRQTVYTAVAMRVDTATTMTRRGGEHYRVLVPSTVAAYPEQVEALVAAAGRPVVDGGHRHGKTGRPGDGCTDQEIPHQHRCGGCRSVMHFHPQFCQHIAGVPPCPECGSTDWRSRLPAFPDWIWP
jgi:hypothetical protein